MKLPIDTTGMTFLAAGPAEPVVDFESKQPKVDDNGEAIYALQLVVLGGGGADVIGVKVTGEPKGLAQGTAVRVTGLVATPWSMGDRSGVAFRAGRVESIQPAKAA